MNRLEEAYTKYGIKINTEKVKDMKIMRGENEVMNIRLYGIKIEQVDQV